MPLTAVINQIANTSIPNLNLKIEFELHLTSLSYDRVMFLIIIIITAFV